MATEAFGTSLNPDRPDPRQVVSLRPLLHSTILDVRALTEQSCLALTASPYLFLWTESTKASDDIKSAHAFHLAF